MYEVQMLRLQNKDILKQSDICLVFKQNQEVYFPTVEKQTKCKRNCPTHQRISAGSVTS